MAVASCVSVGFLIHESDTKIVISTTLSDCNDCIDPLTIDRGTILSIRKVKMDDK